MSASPLPTTSSDRLVFVDIFRGLAVAGMILVDNPGSDDKAYWAIKHAPWNGWTPADFIFPSFLLLVGVSLVYSITRRLERGDTRLAIMSHVAKRSLALIAIGLFVNTFPFVDLHFSTLRFYGVTQRIAVCYFVAAILLLWTDRRALWMALIFCLVGYWIVLRFVPVPGFGIPGRDIPFMDPDRNIAAWLDRKLMMGHLYNITRDPEGLLSTIPSIATTLIGVLTGYWLRSEKKPIMKVTLLTIAGVLGMLTGFIWDIRFPINKNLWTSSFVLFTGGFALLFLSFLYWAVEMKKIRRIWTMPALVFGMNAIAGFVADSFVYGPGYNFTARGPNGVSAMWHEVAYDRLLALGGSPTIASLIYSVAAVLFCWILLWLLWRKRIFIKI